MQYFHDSSDEEQERVVECQRSCSIRSTALCCERTFC
jgi:hypothetical protein